MLAREVFRSHPERVREMLTARHTEAPLDRLLEVDAAWREILVEVEELKARRNAGSKEIGSLFREGKAAEAEERKTAMAALGDQIKGLETRGRDLEQELCALELTIPNLFDGEVLFFQFLFSVPG